MKFHNILLLLFVVLGAIQSKAADKKVYLATDLPEATSIGLPGEYELTWLPWSEDDTIEIDLPEDGRGVTIAVNRGYTVTEIDIDDKKYSGMTTSSVFIPNASIPDGSTIQIYAVEQPKKYLVVNADPEKVEVNYMYWTYMPSEWTDNQLRIELTDPYLSVTISSVSGYIIESIMNQGQDVAEGYRTTYSIYPQSLPAGDNVYDVEVLSLEDVRTSEFTVEVVGNPDVVELTMASDRERILTGDDFKKPIKFSPQFDLPIYIQNRIFVESFYKVTVGDRVIPESEYINRIFDLKDGDKIKVEVDFPEEQIPVRLHFTNPDTESSILKIGDTHDHVIPRDEWMKEGWTVPMGTDVVIEFNYEDYELSFTLNGVEIPDEYIGFRAIDPAGYDVTITAVPKDPFEVTFFYDMDAPHFKVLVGKSKTEIVEMNPKGDFTKVPVIRSQNMVRIIPDDGWAINTLYDGSQKANSRYIEIRGNVAITVFMEEYPRDNEVAVYLDPQTDWQYRSVSLSSEDVFRSEEIKLHPGYNVVKYNMEDLPLSLGFAPENLTLETCSVYVNDELFNTGYLVYDLPDGSVIMAYGQTPERYDVTFDIEEGVGFTMLRDVIQEISDPEDQTVLQGTRYDIIPADPMNVVVKINGFEPMLENDRYIVNIDADTEITIEKGIPSEADIVVENKEYDVYTLQGIRVLRSASKSDLQNLPAGIYIVNGKKLQLK